MKEEVMNLKGSGEDIGGIGGGEHAVEMIETQHLYMKFSK